MRCSVTNKIPSISPACRTKRDDEKQATIRQHYYPEGGWGYVVVAVTCLVQAVTHGFQLSLGVLLLALLRRWGEDTMAESGRTGLEEGTGQVDSRWVQN